MIVLEVILASVLPMLVIIGLVTLLDKIVEMKERKELNGRKL